jgi:PAS domain S-box-containing protein
VSAVSTPKDDAQMTGSSASPLSERIGAALLEAAGDAIIFADTEGLIQFWNPGAERVFGFSSPEALGRSLDLIIPEAQRAAHWAGFNRVMNTGHSRYDQGELLAVPGVHCDGHRVSLEFTLTPVVDTSGRMLGLVAVLRDATRKFEELRTLRRDLAALRRASPSP